MKNLRGGREWEGAGVGRCGRGEGESGEGGLKGSGVIGGDAPTLGRDFDELASVVGEVEEDFFGGVGIAAVVDAVGDADIGVRVVGGLGFEVVEEGIPGGKRGDGLEAGEGFGEEPIAEGAGAEGQGEDADGAGGGDLGEGLGA